MKILCIDMGNTRTHCAVLEDFRVLDSWNVPTRGFAALEFPASVKRAGAEGLSWCSVVPNEAARLLNAASEKFPSKSFHLNCDTSPMRLDMDIPSQVGQDRIAAAIGAGEFMKPPYIVVDMGTAMTIDLVDKNGAYAGGAIAPGLYAFTNYLEERTALLPAIDAAVEHENIAIGKNTRDAMYIGCVKGFCNMVDSIIGDMKSAFFADEDISQKTLFTGGGLSLLPKKWLAGRKVEVNLANIGLYKAYILKI